MLQFFRENVKSWVFLFLLGLIVISFALFGITEFLGGNQSQSVAKVNGEEISQREYDRALTQASRDGRQIDDNLKNQVVEQLIQQRLVQEGLGNLDLNPSNRAVTQAVISNSAFQVDGEFDQERYINTLRSQGLSPAQYESSIKNSVAAEEFSQAVQNTGFANRLDLTAKANQQSVRAQLEKRDFAWALLPISAASASITVSDEEIATYYDNNPDEFTLNEGVKLRYISLSLDDYASEPTEEQIEAYYQDNIANYSLPGKREMSYLTLDASEALDAALVDEIRALDLSADQSLSEIQTTIDQVVTAQSSTSVTYDEGQLSDIDQGLLAEVFDQSVADAVFETAEGDFAFVKTGPQQYQLLLVTRIYEGEQTPLSEVRSEIIERIKQEQALPQLLDARDVLNDQSFQNPYSLEPAAEAVGVEIETSDWLYQDGSGDSELNSNAELTSYAFSDNATEDGFNSDLIETENGVVVARFSESRASFLQPLEDVRDKIEARLIQSKSRENVAKLADTLIEDVRSANSTPTAYFESQGYTVEATDQAMTQRSARSQSIPNPIMNVAFNDVQSADIADAQYVALNNDFAAIVWVKSIEPVSDDDPVLAQLMAQSLDYQDNQVSSIEARSLIGAMREAADIEIYQDNL